MKDIPSEINKIVSGLDNINKAKPDEKFLLQMEEMALAYFKSAGQFSKISLMAIAASFLILLSVNIWSISNTSNSTYDTQITSTTESTDYDLVPTINLYP